MEGTSAVMAERVKCVTLTQFIEVGEETLLDLRTHILPLGNSHLSERNDHDQTTSNEQGVMNQSYGYWSEQRKKPYAWFSDQCNQLEKGIVSCRCNLFCSEECSSNQELLVCVHEIIYTKAVENLLHHRTQSKPNSAVNNKPAYNFRRSDNLRMLMTFRPVKHRQHILLPTQSNSDQLLVPRAAILSEYGRRVLPYLNTHTFGGAGYRAYQILPEALHVFVDQMELTSPHGIFKLLSLLDPKHLLSPDILSYFKQAASEDSEQAEVLPQVPVAGLMRKVYGSNKRNAKLSTRPTKSKGNSVKQQSKSKREQQSTILKAFAKYQPVTEQKDGDEVLPDDILDDVWDFELSQPCPAVNEETEPDDCHKDKQQMHTTSISPKLSTETCGAKRQKSTAACTSSPTAAKNKKAKLSKLSPVTKQQNDITKHTQPDFNDPFDELAASQAIRAENESSAAVHIIKHQWMRLDEEDDVDGEEEEFDTALDSFTTSTLKQQDKERTETAPCAITSLPKLPSTTSSSKQQQHRESIEGSPSTTSSTSQDVLNITSKNIDDMLFGISTPDIELSPAASSETEEDQTFHSLQLEEHSVPRLARRSASQPASHCLSKDQRATTSSTMRPKSYSDSVLETEVKAKFDDITNTVSPRKKLDNESVRRSIVDLTQTPGDQRLQSKVVDKKKKRKKKPFPTSGVEIFTGAKQVADLSHQQLTDWMRLNQPVLMNVFKRKEYSWRHEKFSTNPKMRAAMKWQYDCRRFTDDQVKVITDILLKIFCWRHMKYFNYVMSVLLPESLVRIIADVHKVTFEEAEKLMFSFQGRARVDLTTD